MKFANPTLLATVSALLLSACLSNDSDTTASPTNNNLSPQQARSTPRADCGPGSRPEPGMQGRVSQADHDSGQAAAGFICNMQLVGSQVAPIANGTVGGFKTHRYVDSQGNECAYYDSTLLFPTNLVDGRAGVIVLDMADPSNPVQTASLVTPAMLSPHESLVLSEEAGILAAVLGNPAFGPGVIDVYDIKTDCRNPQLLSSSPLGIFGHESGLSPDGKTFYAGSPGTSTLVAVDISNPAMPQFLWQGNYPSHGLTLSEDGNRAYVASIGDPAGVLILDVSDIQSRQADPQVTELANLTWDTVSIPQNAMPFTKDGKQYLMEIDEFASASDGGQVPAGGAPDGRVGAARIIDITDETNPFVVSDLRLEVHDSANRAEIANDPGASNPTGGYAGHYCSIPTADNPTIVACSMIVSGLRVFDISDLNNPVEVAYHIAPTKDRLLPVPAPASAYAMSAPAFAPERKEIWYSDGYSGFYALKVTNGAWK
ncbi:MAG: hypothetical protein R3194_02065 [Limnobacter sp.]|nr:hypothetical protein [Limnobacter sp.]